MFFYSLHIALPQSHFGFLGPSGVITRLKHPASLVCLLCGFLLTACSAPLPYVSKPSGQEEARRTFATRSLNDAALQQFLISAGQSLPHQDQAWDFETLSLVSTFFNPDMAVSEARWREAMAASGVLLSSTSPQLDFLIEHHSVTEPARPRPWSWGIGFEFVLPDADRVAAKTQLANVQVTLARLEVASSSWRGRSALRAAWIDYFIAKDRAVLVEQQRALSQAHLLQIRQRVDSGLQGRGDLQAAQDSVQIGEIEHAEMQRALRTQQAYLRTLIFLPPSESALPLLQEWDWQALMKKVINLREDVLQDLALTHRLDLRGAEARYAVADAKLRLEVAQQYPEISLKPGYEWDQGDHRLKLGLGLPIALPGAHKAAVERASAERDTQGQLLLATQEQVLQELTRAYKDCLAVSDKLNDVKRAQALSERARDQVKLTIRLGEADPIQAFEAELKVIHAKTQTLEAQRDLQQNLARLEDVLQQPLMLISVRGAP